MAIILVNVYSENLDADPPKPLPGAIDVLWKLLLQREAHQNISHRKMPTYKQHLAFVNSKPYLEWFLICNGKDYVGSVYISHQNEIGLFIFVDHQHKGFGAAALKEIKSRFPNKRLLANIAPTNKASQHFFQEHGFRLIQYTYEFGL